jgi:predicted metal-dependent hydrolase
MRPRHFVYGRHSCAYRIVVEDRRTLSLVVLPDLSVIVKCPHGMEVAEIECFLKRKWLWLKRQLTFFSSLKTSASKEYVSGESHYYLGRQYMLVVKKGEREAVSISFGKLLMTTRGVVTNTDNNRAILEFWYAERARTIFQERLTEVVSRFRIAKAPDLSVRRMTKRWGSFIGKRRIILNIALIHTSKDCIDYVITHELCHFFHRSHDARFFRLLGEKYPNWEKVKEKLEVRYGFVAEASLFR